VLPQKKEKSRRSAHVTWAEAGQNVLIASMNRGLFPFAVIAILVGLIVRRMPADDVSTLAFQILEDAQQGTIVGWLLFCLSIGGWATHVRIQRRTISAEYLRMSKERNTLQEKAIGKPLSSSNDGE